MEITENCYGLFFKNPEYPKDKHIEFNKNNLAKRFMSQKSDLEHQIMSRLSNLKNLMILLHSQDLMWSEFDIWISKYGAQNAI